MVKVVGLLHKKEGMGRDEFLRYWRDVHAPLVVPMPGLRRYVISVAVQLQGSSEAPRFDGVAELWFDDGEAVKTAFASPQGQKVQNDAANFCEYEICLTEEISIVS